MITIYHLPRCGKSRKALSYLQENNIPHRVVYYVQHPLSPDELAALQAKLEVLPTEWIRVKEAGFVAGFSENQLSPSQCIDILTAHPEWMQRPIIEKGDKAIIAREEGALEKFLETETHP